VKADDNDMAVARQAQTADAGWVAEAQSGSAAAFERLYRQHVGRVYALCIRMTGNTAMAEDLTQETFLRAWRGLDAFRGDSSFATWLHRLAVNQVLSERRSAARRTARNAEAHERHWAQDHSAGDAGNTRLDLEQAIASLPEGARRVFVLHDIEGLRHEEVASVMGTAVGTSKAQLHRARKLLREALSK
jgi:RNA polymerase sigma-70 factor, ECF subfamily